MLIANLVMRTHVQRTVWNSWKQRADWSSDPYLIRRLQSVQNAAARLVCKLRRFDHITDALISLYWLRIPERIIYKIAVLTFKVLHGTAPKYLEPLVRVADLPGRQALRFASTNRPAVPPYKLSTIGSRVFPVAGPHRWNSLPEEITSHPRY